MQVHVDKLCVVAITVCLLFSPLLLLSLSSHGHFLVLPFFSEQDELYEFKCAMRKGFDVLVANEKGLSFEVPHFDSA